MEGNSKKLFIGVIAVLILLAVSVGLLIYLKINDGPNETPKQEIEGQNTTGRENEALNQNTSNKENETLNQNTTETNETNNESSNDENNENQSSRSELDLDFIKIEDDSKNMIYSPLSIKQALSMLNDGANGDTKKQISRLLNNVKINKFKDIDDTLSFANAVFIKDTFASRIKEEYTNNLKEKYNAELKLDAFEDAKNINSWIKIKTLGLIRNILEDETVKNAQLILVNALAIKMDWQVQFKDNSTTGGDFYLQDGKTMKATTMSMSEVKDDSIRCYKNKTYTALSMDLKQYGDTQLEFLAIMPENNLPEHIKTITVEELKKIENKLVSTNKIKDGANIYIPKFSFEYELDFKEDLNRLGMKDAFIEGKADFSNITGLKDLFVNKAIHKANIDFTEKGVKAAAVTVFSMGVNSMAGEKIEKNPVEIRINKPFLFFIKDKKTDEIWFTGSVYEPNKWEKDKEQYQER